jgi:hypothetical protein
MLRGKLTTALLIAAAVWPSGANARIDPPVLPTALPTVEASPPQDLRSPDARDAALAADTSPAHDQRSPNAREPFPGAAVGPGESAGMPASHPAPSVSEGFGWSEAGIGAAAMLALVSLASGTLLLVGRSRRRTPTT